MCVCVVGWSIGISLCVQPNIYNTVIKRVNRGLDVEKRFSGFGCLCVALDFFETKKDIEFEQTYGVGEKKHWNGNLGVILAIYVK
jgi:hypothetical protein